VDEATSGRTGVVRPVAAGVVRRRGLTVVAMAIGAILVVLGSLLPWLRTGARQRNSYDAFAVADRLGFGPGGAAAEGLRWWPLVPLLTAAAVVAAWWGWRRPGGLIGMAAGLYAFAVGAAVAMADQQSAVDIRPGATVTAVGGAVLALASVATALVTADPPTGPAR
jgi:hypothetical protein